MHSLFITGTDTGVGKTVVAARLIAQARIRVVDAVPMKPVQTGCERAGRRLIAPDLEFCLAAARIRASEKEKAQMCPYRFEPACSPHLAARLARRPIRIERIVACFRELERRHEMVVVEGAGGALVPLGPARTMLDLMRALGLPVLVAARAGLGTINHTLLTLHELKRARLRVEGVIFVSAAPEARPELVDDNARTIERLTGTPVLSHIRFSKVWKKPHLIGITGSR